MVLTLVNFLLVCKYMAYMAYIIRTQDNNIFVPSLLVIYKKMGIVKVSVS
jgi:hypothetical protein